MADLRSTRVAGNQPGSDGSQSRDSRVIVPRVSPDPAGPSLADRVRSESVPVWVLLPFRAFMGFTFVFAGLQKLSSRSFFTAGAPGSIQEQLQASRVRAPCISWSPRRCMPLSPSAWP